MVRLRLSGTHQKPCIMKHLLFLLSLTFLSLCRLAAQSTSESYTSKTANLGEIQLEYMDFGGEGVPLIYVQDFHNYFEGPYYDSLLISFLAQLAQHNRVLAPLRRGYGRSTGTEWGYDVATQAEDLLHLMDALGIEKAVLLGRLPANQDLTWIAEHRPERLAGLIYWGDPVLLAACADPDERILLENFSALAPDFEKEAEKRMVMSRAYYRPRFLRDSTIQIKVPTLRIKSPQIENRSVLRRLVEEGVLDEIIQTDMPGYEEEQAALRSLLQDTSRRSRLQAHLIACDSTPRINQGMARAFGPYAKTVNIDMIQFDYFQYLSDLQEPIRDFLKGIHP